jgi:hypothetical protein
VVREKRGRVTPEPKSEPTYLPEPPRKLVFGEDIPCSWCGGKGLRTVKKKRGICGICHGRGFLKA